MNNSDTLVVDLSQPLSDDAIIKPSNNKKCKKYLPKCLVQALLILVPYLICLSLIAILVIIVSRFQILKFVIPVFEH